ADAGACAAATGAHGLTEPSARSPQPAPSTRSAPSPPSEPLDLSGLSPLSALSTEGALRALRARGLAATAVTTDLAELHHDPRFAGSISRDAHGAPAVPDPWSFV
ncbi:CoA transferase, partial [Streptomyces sp. NPDC006450]